MLGVIIWENEIVITILLWHRLNIWKLDLKIKSFGKLGLGLSRGSKFSLSRKIVKQTYIPVS